MTKNGGRGRRGQGRGGKIQHKTASDGRAAGKPMAAQSPMPVASAREAGPAADRAASSATSARSTAPTGTGVATTSRPRRRKTARAGSPAKSRQKKFGKWRHRFEQLRAGAVICLLLSLAGCETTGPSAPSPAETAALPPGQLVLQPASFATLPGWGEDRLSEAMPALLRSCNAIAKLPADRALGPDGLAGTPADWQSPCLIARNLPASDDRAIANYFQSTFQPFLALDSNGKPGLFTSYFEPELLGSRKKTAVYKVPLYRAPQPPVTYSRAEIEAGALAGRHLELLWVADPVDAFFLQVQGSGRIRLPDGSIQRVGYAGDNGQKFGPIGRMMIDAGLVDRKNASMQAMRDWLKAHPKEAVGWMQKNPRYVFFREIKGDGPIGAQSQPLTPGRSLAVDPAYLALGLPLWLDTTWPVDHGDWKRGDPFRRLMVAQDVGAAIKGPVRGDIFWGSGEEALRFAGNMKGAGSYYILLPKAVAARREPLLSDVTP
jgi:membrane-bound lytic murein transglycosylase A